LKNTVWKLVGPTPTTNVSPVSIRGIAIMVDETERARGRFGKKKKKNCRKRDDETQYKRAQKNITGMKGYDWARSLGPALILEKLSSTGES